MPTALSILLLGAAASIMLYLLVLAVLPHYWKTTTDYKSESIEKACDSVTAFVAFLVPATLAITTWVYEKTGTLWYGALLALSTLWFLVVLVFTMYMRFNFLWRQGEKITVGDGKNMVIVKWLTTIMVGLSVGLFFLAIPTFVLPFQTAPKTEVSEPKIHYEYHIIQDGYSSSCGPCTPMRKQPSSKDPCSREK